MLPPIDGGPRTGPSHARSDKRHGHSCRDSENYTFSESCSDGAKSVCQRCINLPDAIPEPAL